MRKKYYVCVLTLLFFSCVTGRKKVIDYYEITWGDYYTQGRSGYCIGCEIRGESDSIVENVKKIRWNNQIIIIEKNTTEELRWFIFLAEGDSLKCGNGDKFIGPIQESQVDSILFVHNYNNLKDEFF